MPNKYLYYFEKGIFNNKSEQSLLYQLASKQSCELLFNYLINKYPDIDPITIIQLIFDVVDGKKCSEHYSELRSIIIFTKMISKIIFIYNEMHDFLIIDIPENIDITFIRQLLFDYGLRMRIFDNKLMIYWKKEFNLSNNYPYDELLPKNLDQAYQKLK